METPPTDPQSAPADTQPAAPAAETATPPADIKPGMFRGRIGRLGYLAFLGYYVLSFVIIIALFALFSRIGGPSSGLRGVLGTLVFLIAAVLVIGYVVIGIGINIRRWHDIGQSGWFILLNFIPLVSLVVAVLMFVLPGTPGPNKFGKPYTGGGHFARVLGF